MESAEGVELSLFPGKLYTIDVIKKFKKKIKKNFQKIKSALRTGYIVLAHILIDIGYVMLKRKKKYQVITRLIEELFISLDVYIKVERVSEYPLYVSFHTVIESGSSETIDWKYFTLELIYQLGCMFSDVVIEKDTGTKKDDHKYFIDITKTAITNLEKGVSSNQPMLFEAENTTSIIKRVVEMVRFGEKVSPKYLEDKLNINEYRAEKLYEQLEQAGFLEKKKPRNVTIN